MTRRNIVDLKSKISAKRSQTTSRTESRRAACDSALEDMVESTYGWDTIHVGELAAAIDIPTVSTGQTPVYFATGIVFPEEGEAVWCLLHINKGEWHSIRMQEVDQVIADGQTTAAGEERGDDEVFDEFVDLFTSSSGHYSFVCALAVTPDRELLIAVDAFFDTHDRCHGVDPNWGGLSERERHRAGGRAVASDSRAGRCVARATGRRRTAAGDEHLGDEYRVACASEGQPVPALRS